MHFLNTKPGILPVLIAALILMTAACGNSDNRPAQQNEPAQTEEAAGDTSEAGKKLADAPDFTLEKRDGKSFTLSDHEGKVIVLNFWATWCGPCREEIPDFMELQEEMKDEGVLFAGVSLDQEGWEKVRPYAKEMGINYPVMVDDGKVSRYYGPIRTIPTTYIINKKGKVEYVAPGMLTKDLLEPILDELTGR